MQIAKIRLRKPRRVFSFRCDNINLQRDDPCIVHTDRGMEWGTCVLPPEPCSEAMAKLYTMRVVRKANSNDMKTFDMLLHDERRAYAICAEKIRQHNLAMKLVSAEYTFDKRRLIFYFTAEDRIDFRELVRDLAHEFRVRIELRHIQVRDEAKMLGGLGCCGLQLCCTAWLDEFKAISMRMAKRQNLSLNPAKISGQCGRLLCCLDYENKLYKPIKKKNQQSQVPEENNDTEEKQVFTENAAEELPLDTEDEQISNAVEEETWDTMAAEDDMDENRDYAPDVTESKPSAANDKRLRHRRRRHRHA